MLHTGTYKNIQEHIHVSVNVKSVICRYVYSCMKMYADAETHSIAQLRWKGNFSPDRICHNTPPFVVGGLSQGPRRGPHRNPIFTPSGPRRFLVWLASRLTGQWLQATGRRAGGMQPAGAASQSQPLND